MKRFISQLLILLLVFSHATTVNAVPSFGTIMPKEWGWQAGGEVSTVFNREVKEYNAAATTSYFYNLSFGFADWFSFDGKLGLGDITVEPKDGKSRHFDVHFSGGYGWRAKIFENKKKDVRGILSFQHISTHPQKENVNGLPYSIIWDDWQVHMLASKKIGRFSPYCGVKWSFVYLIRKINHNRNRRHSRDAIGLIVGTDFKMGDYIYMNMEGRFFDETALSTGFTVRY